MDIVSWKSLLSVSEENRIPAFKKQATKAEFRNETDEENDMSFEFIKNYRPAGDQRKYPLSEELAAIKKARDEEIRKVFTGESDKFLVIIGPCSR